MTIEVVEALQSLQNGFFDVFFNFISFLGEEYVYIVLLSIIYFAYDKKMGEFMGLVLFFTGMFNATIKGIVSAPRPFQEYPDRITNLRPETSGGYSFPSGHTQMFTSFSFAYGFYQKQIKIVYVATIFSVLMALSRMYLGVHYLEDVTVSLLLGILTAYLFAQFFVKIQDNDKALLQVYIGILLAFLPFLFILDYVDLYKTYGLMLGFTGGMVIEKKYIQFTMDTLLWKKGLRVLGGLIIMIAIMAGLDIIFEAIAKEGSTLLHLLDMIRYGLVAFVGLGVYPLLFKPLHIH
ncbi:phosphatase PAP2 family protein [Candidatus Xianfuyuplasma coldseepsis]|uniref:Phosphatase PAP2 family protein n=1 Tax=Candidatus Xianfuyuplasma coldseepsis TaxID=2782163 RepID=A0A7L7KRS9_9MOLU|nr:phosphatase PAP2 family protein [Xianfuyuplasma coldseepsis]QMS84508.1 phosphatase PAP2 family protein [Xianfuyuplasma coldseepsis]